MDRKKITIYQKLKIFILLQAGFTYEKIRDQLDVSNGCITNVEKTGKFVLVKVEKVDNL